MAGTTSTVIVAGCKDLHPCAPIAYTVYVVVWLGLTVYTAPEPEIVFH